jgi:topoisomerase-4 subunit A
VEAKAGAIACLSEKGRLLVFGMAEMKSLSGGGRGVILMDLDEGEKLIAAQAASKLGVTVSGTGRGGKAQAVDLSAAALQPHIGKRARKGRLLASRIKPSGLTAIK